MTNLTAHAHSHIETLIRHGAALKAPDGSRVELTTAFCEKAVSDCLSGGFNAITYYLDIPGIDDKLMLAIWKDGHIDSGSVPSVCRALDR